MEETEEMTTEKVFWISKKEETENLIRSLEEKEKKLESLENFNISKNELLLEIHEIDEEGKKITLENNQENLVK